MNREILRSIMKQSILIPSNVWVTQSGFHTNFGAIDDFGQMWEEPVYEKSINSWYR